VTLYHAGTNDNNEGVKDGNGEAKIQTHVIWDRKVEGGFPGMWCLFLFSYYRLQVLSTKKT
jgi:hypothetical protein